MAFLIIFTTVFCLLLRAHRRRCARGQQPRVYIQPPPPARDRGDVEQDWQDDYAAGLGDGHHHHHHHQQQQQQHSSSPSARVEEVNKSPCTSHCKTLRTSSPWEVAEALFWRAMESDLRERAREGGREGKREVETKADTFPAPRPDICPDCSEPVTVSQPCICPISSRPLSR